MAATASALSLPVSRREKGEEERQLVRLAQSGEAAAFEELIRRHQQRVFGLVSGILRRREDVEDVVQQVFLKVFVSLKRFDQRAAFSTWLYKISVNECWDYLRKKKVRPLVYEADLSEEQVSRLDGVVSADQPATSSSDRAEARDLLERMMEKLPEQDRELLVLKNGRIFGAGAGRNSRPQREYGKSATVQGSCSFDGRVSASPPFQARAINGW